MLNKQSLAEHCATVWYFVTRARFCQWCFVSTLTVIWMMYMHIPNFRLLCFKTTSTFSFHDSCIYNQTRQIWHLWLKNIYSVSLYQATIMSVCPFYNTCCACHLSCTTVFPYTGTGLSSQIGINIILNKTNISIRRSYSVLESICKSTCFEYLIFIPGYILLDESSERQVRLTSVPTINVPI